MKKVKKVKKDKCWLCGKSRPKPDTSIVTACETPNGIPCKPKPVLVHFTCYLDIDSYRLLNIEENICGL